jgi:hypothetical protein
LLLQEPVCYRGTVRRLLFLVGSLSGCLFVGSKNEPPRGTIRLSSTTAQKCGEVTLEVEASDPDDDPLGFGWFVRVTSEEPGMTGERDLTRPGGAPGCPAGSEGINVQDAGAAPPLLGSARSLKLTHLPLRGTYHVRVELKDSLGAAGVAEASFRVGNQAPEIQGLQLVGATDPAFETSAVYPAHGEYMAAITQIKDGDDNPRCANKQLGLFWEPVGRAVQDFEEWQELCDDRSYPFGAVRFRLRRKLAVEAGLLQVKVTVSDPMGGADSEPISRQVAANRPPCIAATEPYHDRPLKVAAAEANSFTVSSVSDDVVQDYYEYAWSVREKGAAGFTPLAASGRTLTLPAWFGGPGHELELRAAVREIDEAGRPLFAEPACASSLARCRSAELPPEKACYRWVTWTVELQ